MSPASAMDPNPTAVLFNNCLRVCIRLLLDCRPNLFDVKELVRGK